MSGQPDNSLMVIGKITSVYGIKGWVKLYSYTDPMENIFNYQPWQLRIADNLQKLDVQSGKRQGKGLIAKIAGVDDRSEAYKYCGYEILVASSLLPELEQGEFYWSQLQNLLVYTEAGLLLGKVSHLLETGANDVLVVKSTAESIDQRERLLPYIPEQVIINIDLAAGFMQVNWEAEF